MHRRANFRAERRFQDISQNLGNLWWHFTGYRRPSYFGLSRVLKEFIRIGRRVALCNLPERITHSRSNRPIGKLPAADAGYRTAGDGGHGHVSEAVVVGGELNGRRGSFGYETASRIEPVMAYPFFLTVVVLVINQQDTPFFSSLHTLKMSVAHLNDESWS